MTVVAAAEPPADATGTAATRGRPLAADLGVTPSRPPPRGATASALATTAGQATAATPALRVPPLAEPPPWLDVPFENEVEEPAYLGVPPEPAFIAPEAELAADRQDAAFPEDAEPSEVDMAAPTTGLMATPLGTRWADLVRELIASGRIGAFARELAMQAQCVGWHVEGDAEPDAAAAIGPGAERGGDAPVSARPIVCQLRVERETLRAAPPREKLQAALVDLLGGAVRIETQAGVADDSPAKREAAERTRLQARAEQIIYDDPLVRTLMAQFKTARIVPGSIKPH